MSISVIGVCVFLLVMGVETDAPAAPRVPRFSWETVPVCIHFGKASDALTDEELQFVARTASLVCLEKGHGTKRFGSTEKGIAHDAERLKALNPKITVLYYWNAVLNYPLYDACDEVKRHPTWILRDEAGRPIYKKETLEQYNMLDPDFRKWWASEAGKAVSERQCDGIFMDAVTQVRARILRQIGGGPEKERLLRDAVVDMMQGARTSMGPNGFILYNGLRNADGRNGAVGKEYLPFADGAMVEHFTASQSKEIITRDIETIVQAGESGKTLVVKGWPEPGFIFTNQEKMSLSPEELAKEAKAKITFALACFLIAAQENSYFCYSWGYRENHGSLIDYPEFQRLLGAPQGEYARDGWRFSRSFKHARVSVDLSRRLANIEWIETASKPDAGDGK